MHKLEFAGQSGAGLVQVRKRDHRWERMCVATAGVLSQRLMLGVGEQQLLAAGRAGHRREEARTHWNLPGPSAPHVIKAFQIVTAAIHFHCLNVTRVPHLASSNLGLCRKEDSGKQKSPFNQVETADPPQLPASWGHEIPWDDICGAPAPTGHLVCAQYLDALIAVAVIDTLFCLQGERLRNWWSGRETLNLCSHLGLLESFTMCLHYSKSYYF